MMGTRAALLAAFAATGLFSSLAWADSPGESAQRNMRIDFDQTSVVRLDRTVKTILIGNPAIADAQLVDGKTVYVLGRMFGQTNIVALDASGAEVMNTRITVGVSNASVEAARCEAHRRTATLWGRSLAKFWMKMSLRR